MGVLDWHSAQD